jgi:hypothetical protein
MNKRDMAEYRRALGERDTAEREYAHFIERRLEIAKRQVKNEQLKERFLLRLDRDIEDARQRLVAADLAVEGYEK